MTEEEVRDIRAALAQPEVSFDDAMWTLNALVPKLLDENAALREALRRVADAYSRDMLAEIGHDNIDEIREARALLGMEP